MKTLLFITMSFAGMATWMSCNDAEGTVRAIDLETGQEITVVKDTATGNMINEETRKPVELFVNRTTKDTIYGITGEVVNNKLQTTEDGKYVYKDGDYKMKIEKDNDYKMKYGDDYKEKYDDGEYKVKHGDYKKEVERDGDVTIKKGDRKMKIDGETGEVKVKN